MKPALREKHTEAFLRFYHSKLLAELSKYGHDGNKLYPMERLIQDYGENMGHGFYWGIINAWTHAT